MEREHFAERIQRILLMAPLYRLGRRHFKTADGKDVSGMELGLMTLLFFFEQMLDGKKKAGIRNLSLFLKQAVRGRLFSDDASYEQLARDIVAVFRPPTGRRNEESFYDWEQDAEGTAQYSYLKADKADVSANEQYYVLDVERRLEFVHNLHRSLLQAGIELGTSALAAAEEALYFSGIDSFNFEQEITHRVFSSPLPVEASRRLIEPFLSLEQCRVWSPLAVFFPQRLDRMEQDSENEAFPQMREDEEDARESRNLHNLQEHYAAIVRFLLDFMGEKRETTLADFCGYLQEAEPSWFDNRQFYLFWMLLHRQGTLVMSEDSIGPSSVYAAVMRQCPELRSIRVVECSQILDFSGYAISDMNIEVTVNDGTESE